MDDVTFREAVLDDADAISDLIMDSLRFVQTGPHGPGVWDYLHTDGTGHHGRLNMRFS